MGRWQYIIYLLRLLAVKLMTRRGLTLAAILTYGLAVAFDPRPEPIVGDKPIREILNLTPHLTTDEAQLSQAPISISTGKSKPLLLATTFHDYFIAPA